MKTETMLQREAVLRSLAETVAKQQGSERIVADLLAMADRIETVSETEFSVKIATLLAT